MAGFVLITVVVGFIAFVAWLTAIDLLIKVGTAKGYSMSNKGLLWFIGIFATPLVVGLYVAALPDNRIESKPIVSSDSKEDVIAREAEQLPSL